MRAAAAGERHRRVERGDGRAPPAERLARAGALPAAAASSAMPKSGTAPSRMSRRALPASPSTTAPREPPREAASIMAEAAPVTAAGRPRSGASSARLDVGGAELRLEGRVRPVGRNRRSPDRRRGLPPLTTARAMPDLQPRIAQRERSPPSRRSESAPSCTESAESRMSARKIAEPVGVEPDVAPALRRAEGARQAGEIGRQVELRESQRSGDLRPLLRRRPSARRRRCCRRA